MLATRAIEMIREMMHKDNLMNGLGLEQYLREFLTDGNIPMENNAAERAIRPFTIGRKNWVMCDTIYGAEDSAIIYSITETAKANDLKPWSDTLPSECRKRSS